MREITMVTIYFPPCGAFFDASTGPLLPFVTPSCLGRRITSFSLDFSSFLQFYYFLSIFFLCADDNFYKASVTIEKTREFEERFFNT